MSRKNVEVVRQIFEAFNRRDWAEWEAHHHPDVLWSNPPEAPDSGIRRGVGEVRGIFDELLDLGGDWQVEVEEIAAVGKERVLMRGRSVFVGRASGIPIEDPVLQLFDLEDGRVRRVQTFRSLPEALEAAGLRE
jgi:ketosteroid isomerase-like protein